MSKGMTKAYKTINRKLPKKGVVIGKGGKKDEKST